MRCILGGGSRKQGIIWRLVGLEFQRHYSGLGGCGVAFSGCQGKETVQHFGGQKLLLWFTTVSTNFTDFVLHSTTLVLGPVGSREWKTGTPSILERFLEIH